MRVGCCDGVLEGLREGARDGVLDGLEVEGVFEGVSDGALEGLVVVGPTDGFEVVGPDDGFTVGVVDGRDDDGVFEGVFDGEPDGLFVGDVVGSLVGNKLHVRSETHEHKTGLVSEQGTIVPSDNKPSPSHVRVRQKFNSPSKQCDPTTSSSCTASTTPVYTAPVPGRQKEGALLQKCSAISGVRCVPSMQIPTKYVISKALAEAANKRSQTIFIV